MTKEPSPRATAHIPFAYPKGWNSTELRFSRKGRKLADAMMAYAEPRLLPKLQARGGANYAEDFTVEFADACVYLIAWLGERGIVQFPFARLYPVVVGSTTFPFGGRRTGSARRRPHPGRCSTIS